MDKGLALKKINTLFYCSLAVSAGTCASVMRHDISVQDYRDFGENLGKYHTGSTQVPVYRKDGTLDDYLQFSIPDFGMVVNGGYSTLVSPSYLASVRHNTGYQSVSFGNGAKYAASYKLINRNESQISNIDFHLPRLNKVVTDAAPASIVDKSTIRSGDRARYYWYARTGGGTQKQISDDQTEELAIADAYKWKSGGTFANASVTLPDGTLRWKNDGPGTPNSTPFSAAALGGDSGSPVFVYDELEKVWKLAGVLHASISNKGIYQRISGAEYIPDNYLQDIQALNSVPDVTDKAGTGDIIWTQDAITQGSSRWRWAGLAEKYKNQAPSQASNEELDATKDLRFNGAGDRLMLDDAINMGAGKLQFSANYTVQPGSNTAATWAGGGIEVDAGHQVLWGVNGVAGDALHKIGEGTLHVNATGANPGSLNVGDGTVVLDQQPDAAGNKQAFSSVTLVSGRPTVVLGDANQVSPDAIFFGYRGGALDLNGSSLSFREINHTDDGATLVNHNLSASSTLTLAGHSGDETEIHSWTSTRKGTPGDLYVYNNPYSHKTEYFRLKKSSYSYFPTDATSTETWEYMGENQSQAVSVITGERNRLVFRGFLGERDPSRVQGALNLNVAMPEGIGSVMALTGGSNISGNMNVETGTLLLSGQPVPHAGSVVYDDDWQTADFRASAINVQPGAALQVGTWARVESNINAANGAQVMLGYRDSEDGGTPLWRCFAVINAADASCGLTPLSQAVADALPQSTLRGDITLDNGAYLQLGKIAWQGVLSGEAQSSMNMAKTSLWQMTGSSTVSSLTAVSGSRISFLPAQNDAWRAKTLTVDELNATGALLSLGLDAAAGTGDTLVIRDKVTGSSNTLNIVPEGDTQNLTSLKQNVVFADAPGDTSHDYFRLASMARGFTLYTPDYQVEDSNGRVQWLLRGEEEQNADDDNTAPADKGNDTPPDNGSTAPSDNGNDTPPENGSTAPRENSSEAKPSPAVKPDKKPAPDSARESWLIAHDNHRLIQDTRTLMGTRRYLLDRASGELQSRAHQLRQSWSQDGTWANLEQTRGGYGRGDITRSVLSVGVDNLVDNQLYGLSASMTQGNVKGAGREQHNLYAAGAYYGWESQGLSVDFSAQYMRLVQDFSFDPSLEMGRQKQDSDILAASLRTGYRLPTGPWGFTLTPYAELGAAAVSGYSMTGKDARISLSSGMPWRFTSGLSASKALGELPLAVTADLAWQYSGDEGGSTLMLTDGHGSRSYREGTDSSMLAELGLQGQLAANWSASARMSYRTGTLFRDEAGGGIGINYQF